MAKRTRCHQLLTADDVVRHALQALCFQFTLRWKEAYGAALAHCFKCKMEQLYNEVNNRIKKTRTTVKGSRSRPTKMRSALNNLMNCSHEVFEAVEGKRSIDVQFTTFLSYSGELRHYVRSPNIRRARGGATMQCTFMRANWDLWLDTVRDLIKESFGTAYKIEMEHSASASDDPACWAQEFIRSLITQALAASDGLLPESFLRCFFVCPLNCGHGNRALTVELMQQEFHDLVRYETTTLWMSAQIDLGQRAWTAVSQDVKEAAVPPDMKELQTLVRYDSRSAEMIRRWSSLLIVDLSRARSCGLPQNIPFEKFKQLYPVLSQVNPADVQAYVCGAHKSDGERDAAIDIIWNQ